MNKMTKRIAAATLYACISATTMAQGSIPPVFGDDSSLTNRDEMARLFITPKRIMWTSNEALFKDKQLLLQPSTGQAELGRRNTCTMMTTAKDTASIIFDFSREIHGGLKLVLGAAKPSTPSLVRIRFGESVGETCSEPFDEGWRHGYSTNNHAMRDMTLFIPREGMIEIGNTGFRFVRIDLLSEKTIYIKEATAVMRYRDIPYLGSFKCSDSKLNDIWMTGAYTVHLNMQEYLWDGIKRDRLIWLGDMHPEVSTIMAVFGKNDIINKSIDLACEQFPLPQWLNGMSAYSMWYLIIMHEWYMHNGDMAYLRQHRDYITGLIDRIDACVDDEGNERLSAMRFLDWPSSPNTKGVESGYRALLAWALTDGEKLAATLGEGAYAEKCKAIKKRLNKQIKDPNNLKQAAALMAIAGTMSPEKACREVVGVDGAKRFSTFYGYYMLQALALAGEHQTAIDIIRDYWGGMLDLGATTFWEDFNIDWMNNAARIDELTPEGKVDVHREYGEYCYPSYRHSFCHGWASGPTAWMSQHILGVEVVEAGCKTVRITPHLGNLEWAEGTFPTPHGIISIRHEKDAKGKITSTIDAPEGVKIVRK